MNEESVNRVNAAACNQEETKQKKPWHAPVMEVVLVRETENGIAQGPDMIDLS